MSDREKICPKCGALAVRASKGEIFKWEEYKHTHELKATYCYKCDACGWQTHYSYTPDKALFDYCHTFYLEAEHLEHLYYKYMPRPCVICDSPVRIMWTPDDRVCFKCNACGFFYAVKEQDKKHGDETVMGAVFDYDSIVDAHFAKERVEDAVVAFDNGTPLGIPPTAKDKWRRVMIETWKRHRAALIEAAKGGGGNQWV